MTQPSRKLDLTQVPVQSGTRYPRRFNSVNGDITARRWQRVGEAAGLTDLGVNRVVLEPGVVSSLRHWHTHDDEMAVVLEGEVVMITNEGETVMRKGEMAGFPKGAQNGHCFVNRSATPVVILAIGGRSPDDETFYSEVDLHAPSDASGKGYQSRAGVPYDDVP